MASSQVFLFVIGGVEAPSACKPYSAWDEYWSSGAEKIGYYDSEERAEFYLEHESSMPATYDCVFQFEEVMDKRIVDVRRNRYDLLVMKYKGICELYGDLCIVGRTALNRLNGYDVLLEDLPAFYQQRAPISLMEAMEATNERSPIDDFNTLHKQMDHEMGPDRTREQRRQGTSPWPWQDPFEIISSTAVVHFNLQGKVAQTTYKGQLIQF
ncbi:hypothetical protein AAC387_Pa08g1380 [Persea americana]